MEVFTEYFKELEEESIRDNFVVIYELLDEMMDFGYPQTTEHKILQECVSSSFTVSHTAIPLLTPSLFEDTSHKNPTNSRFRPDLQLLLQMLSHGEARV